MKPRHAAALALVGWYLMIPPSSTLPTGVAYKEPLRNWKIVRGFETADGCADFLSLELTRVLHLPLFKAWSG